MSSNTSSISKGNQSLKTQLSKLGSLFRRGGRKIIKRLRTLPKATPTRPQPTRANSANSTASSVPTHLTSYIESENEFDYTNAYDFSRTNSASSLERETLTGNAVEDAPIGRIRRVPSMRSVRRWSCDVSESR